jgi:predicted dehydrogenase
VPASSVVRWGVLGTARIALNKVIPAMRHAPHARVDAIASRDEVRARTAAAAAGIPRAFGSYSALIDDPGIDAVYIALPNHLHAPWTIAAAHAGKHVLVEKPIALSANGTFPIIAARNQTGVRIQEAFMIRCHPQWTTTISMVRGGQIGAVRAVHVFFGYRNLDPANIRNIPACGGGALMDIGCYMIHVARWIFDAEPLAVHAIVDRDPQFGIDRLTSMLLDFGGGRHATGTCATQSVPYQRVEIIGETGRIEIHIPFNAPHDRGCSILLDDGSDLRGGGIRAIEFPATDQYTVQAELFSRGILEGTAPLLTLEDSLGNMKVIDHVRRPAPGQRGIERD